MTQNLPIQSPPTYVAIEERSPKNRLATFTLACLFGYWGLHRFYTGKFWTGLLMFLTGGGFLVWWIIDVLVILSGRFKDSEGRVLGPPATVPARQAHHHLPPREAPRRLEQDREDEELDKLLEDPLEEEFRKLETDGSLR